MLTTYYGYTYYGYTYQVSCGEMLREEVQRATPLGLQVDGLMRRGELVSSETVVALLRRRMRAFPGRRA